MQITSLYPRNYILARVLGGTGDQEPSTSHSSCRGAPADYARRIHSECQLEFGETARAETFVRENIAHDGTFHTLFSRFDSQLTHLQLQLPARELLENMLAATTTSTGWGRLKAHVSAGKGDSNKQDALANLHIAGKFVLHR